MNDLQSLGHAAAMYQQDPRNIKNAIHVIQAENALATNQPIPHTGRPVLRLNGLDYFSADDVALAIAWLQRSVAEAAATNG